MLAHWGSSTQRALAPKNCDSTLGPELALSLRQFETELARLCKNERHWPPGSLQALEFV